MRITDEDRRLFSSGDHVDLSRVLGAHPLADTETGVWFAVWAPNADRVEVAGDWNHWNSYLDTLYPDDSGMWHGVIKSARVGHRYKYRIRNRDTQEVLEKADPFAFAAQEPPLTASIVTDLSYEWSDDDWMTSRYKANALDAPMSIYEVHLGSWRYAPGGYRELASQLADYLDETGFTHLEVLPLSEYPFYPSWGYQTLGYFAPTSRFGSPQDFKYFVDLLHQRGYGVILDWVPSHFPTDAHGLARFDGTHLYEHADPRLGFHPDWKSAIFNYGRNEVRSFLMSSAMFWLDEYHVDGIRVDAVASMLYRDYSRDEGEWIPNEFGGRDNIEAVAFLRQLNQSLYARHGDIQTIAEESTSWSGVSRPVDSGGLGFGMKWDMGWMHDTLQYLQRDTVHRHFHHNEITFRMIYAFTENFVLPLSHDEVVHGKGSMVNKMPGDRWQQLANLRMLYGYQWGLPGKKLLFMGDEFAVSDEWNHEQELRWDLLQYDEHQGVQRWVSDLNKLMVAEPSLHEQDFSHEGFGWIVGDDAENSVLVFARYSELGRPLVIAVNFTPVPRSGYRIGVPAAGEWEVVLNSDARQYGGSNISAEEKLTTTAEETHGFAQSLELIVPPLATVILAPASAD